MGSRGEKRKKMDRGRFELPPSYEDLEFAMT